MPPGAGDSRATERIRDTCGTLYPLGDGLSSAPGPARACRWRPARRRLAAPAAGDSGRRPVTLWPSVGAIMGQMHVGIWARCGLGGAGRIISEAAGDGA